MVRVICYFQSWGGGATTATEEFDMIQIIPFFFKLAV